MNYRRCEFDRRTSRGRNDEAAVAGSVRRMEAATLAYLGGGHGTDDKARARAIALTYAGADSFMQSVQSQAIAKGDDWLPSPAQTRIVLEKAAEGRL